MKKTTDTKLQDTSTTNRILQTLLVFLLLVGLTGVQNARAQSFALSNLWTLLPSTSTFLNTTNNLTRGMAYNPATGHVLVVSRTPQATTTNALYILDGATGAQLGLLSCDDTNLFRLSTFIVNMVGVTDDGVIYVGNLTTDSTNTTAGTGPFRLYRWANESAQPTLAYSGAPSGNDPTANNRRFGDSLTLRGTGASTQILLGTLHTNVALLTTTDGTNFTATKIGTDATASDTRWGLAWGTNNTFWAKQNGGNLKQFSLNLVANTAATVTNIAMTTVPGGPLDVDVSRSLTAILGSVGTTNHTLRLYDTLNPAAPVQQDSTRSFSTANANANNVGAVSLRSGKLFAMDCNNGILAFSLNEVYLPPTIKTQPTAVTIWEGAQWWTFTVVAAGNRGDVLTYQWRFGGTNIDGATASSLTLSNIVAANQGYYSVVVSSGTQTLTSSSVLMTVTANPASSVVSNIWNIAPNTRPYMTSGYKEYGVAINPFTTNVIVLTRPNPTNMLVVLDPLTGEEKYYIDYNSVLGASGFNKVDVGDDGIIYLANLTTDTAANSFKIYGLTDDGALPAAGGLLYSGDPGNGTTSTTNKWGGTFAVRGSGLDTQILVAGGQNTNVVVAILTNYNTAMPPLFGSRPIVVTNAPAGFARLGLDWGPGTNTFWGKTSSGSLVLVQFDLNAGTGFVKQTYPTTGIRSIVSSLTGIKYDAASGLLAGLQNGSLPTPVSVPVYDVSDINAGPFWADHELFQSYNADIEFQGNVDFAKGYLVALGVNNGLKAFKVNSASNSLPTILTQPSGGTWFEGTSPTLSVVADSTSPLSYQWYFNGTQTLAGATSASLTLTNIQASQTGKYMVRVSNAGGYRDSQSATLTTQPLDNTAQMTNLWSVIAGSRPYLNNNYYEYGMAFNPANSNVLVVNWINTNSPQSIIGVMDGLTGTHKHMLDISAITNGGNRAVNKVGVSDDGVVYVANRTLSAATIPFVVYRWANDDSATVATEAFKGDPFPTLSPNKYAGYTMDVRGSGVNTEILIGSYDTNVVSMLKTTDGTNFVANEIKVATAPAKFARLGLCFGAGNTFWTKSYAGDPGGPLFSLVQYNLATGTGTNLYSNSSGLPTSSSITTIGYDDTLKMLAGIGTDTSRSVQVFDVSNLTAGPQLRDQKLFPTGNPSIEQNGAITFGMAHTYLFALAENNGVMAFRINTKYSNFKILSVIPAAGSVTLTWEAASGANYQVQRAATVNGGWTDLGSVITATGDTASYTDTTPDPSMRYYRIGQK